MSLPTYLATTVAAALFATLPVDSTAGSTTGSTAGSTMSVNPDPLSAGGSATIDYSDPGMANQSITINIDNGSNRNPEKTTVIIELDANGEGSVIWVVPDWPMANFNGPGVAEIGLPIVST